MLCLGVCLSRIRDSFSFEIGGKMDNAIHPTAVIGSKVRLGKDNVIGAYVVIEGEVEIGNGNLFDSFSVIGSNAEFRGTFSKGAVKIGNNNHIGEHVTIHQSLHEETATVIGDDAYIMTKVHVGHDAFIGNDVTLSSCSIIGGHSVVQDFSNVGLGAVIHQKRVVGRYSMVGMNSTVTKSIPPYVIGWGSPCKPYRINMVGLQRRGMDPKMIEAINYWLSKEQTGVEIKHELSYLVEEQIKAWNELVVKVGGK
jgi:UDP-N-acetylglucosamine acyltransferase